MISNTATQSSFLPPFVKEAVLGRVLFGLGKKLGPQASQYIHTAKGVSMGAVKPGVNTGFLIPNKNSANVLRARYDLGGVLGKGGVLRGDIAVDPKLVERINNFRNKTPDGRGFKNIAGIAGGSLMHGGVLAGTFGVPAATAYTLAKGPSDPNTTRGQRMGQVLGETVGYMAGGPLGLVGATVTGSIGNRLGKRIGGLFSRRNSPAPSMPQQPQPPQMPQPM